MRVHAGWGMNSKMPQVYLHYYGNESSESLLQAYGIITKNDQKLDPLRPKQCPQCSEPNMVDSKFCVKCRMILSYDAYTESLEKQQEEKHSWESMRKELDDIKKLLKRG